MVHIININSHKDLQIQDYIQILSKNFHSSTVSIYYNSHAQPPQRRIKYGRPHDLLS